MEQWSRYGRKTEADSVQMQDECCGKGHRASLLLQTGPGGRICLICLSNLISDKSAFLIHRTYAVEELSMALTDELFCKELLTCHPQFLVAPLADAIGSSTDDGFGKGIMDVILTLCRLSLAGDAFESLLQDFIRQIARQLVFPSLWSPSKCYTLHLMGLLLELHCKQELCVPQAIRNQQDFVPNLMSGLQLPGEELQGEVLYILYRLALLVDGVEELLRYSPRLCHVAIHALLKTESDALRINCIALLSVMARLSLFDIRLGSGSTPDRDAIVQSSKDNVTDGSGDSTCFARTFAEAMKGSLLSSDLQVQLSALQLICFVFPHGGSFDKELQILVEEGIVDYILEIIRLSDNIDSSQALAVDVLILLSTEEHLFPHRFKFGLQTVIHVLEKSIDAPSKTLQTKLLNLLSRSLSDLPGILSIARAEHLLLLLGKILQCHAKSVEDQALVGDTNILPPTFNGVCLALISLTNTPCCASIPNVTRILLTATASAIVSATSKASLNSDASSLTYSASLLQAVYRLNQMQTLDDGAVDPTPEALIELCELYLLPTFTDSLANLDDENLVLAIFQTFTLFLRIEALEATYRFASKLATNRCFSLSFELMAQFPSPHFKESAYEFLSALVDKLSGSTIGVHIEDALPQLPRDPTDLLVLLEQRSAESQQLLSAHHAIISILSTSYSFNDRLAKEIDIVASLEQHLLVNHGSALADSVAPKTILKQFVSLYANAKEALKEWDAVWSVQAETILELVLGRSNCSDLVCSYTPKPVLRWFLRKESLKDVSLVQFLTWFTAVEKKWSGEGPQAMNSVVSKKILEEESGWHSLITLAELVGTENCGTTVLISLLDKLVMQGADDGVRILVRTLTKLARMSVLVGYQLVQHGCVSGVWQIIRIHESKPSVSMLDSCMELLFQLLYDSDPSMDAMADRTWLDVANQCASLVLEKMSSANRFEVLAPLCVVNLILHKSYENDFFSRACELLVCNRDLCAKLEVAIVDASRQGAKLSLMDLKSVDGELLCAAITFGLLRLRCALRFRHQEQNFVHEVHDIGFQPSVSTDSDGNNSNLSTSSLVCEHWCRILYFGPSTLKILASCCIIEIFSQLPGVIDSTQNDSAKLKELVMPINFFAAVTMVLQGSILGDSDQVQKNASCCLSRLLLSHALSSQQKRAVASSPWNHILLENLVFSLLTPKLNQDSGTCRSHVMSFSAAYVAVGLLKIDPRQSFISSIFSHSTITNIVSNLSEDDISPVIVSLFHQLLISKYLTKDHVRILRDLFQATRRKWYDRGSSLHLGDTPSHDRQICSRILKVDHLTNHIIHSAILELAITSRNEHLESFSNNFDTDEGALTSMLDTFVQDSYLQFE